MVKYARIPVHMQVYVECKPGRIFNFGYPGQEALQQKFNIVIGSEDYQVFHNYPNTPPANKMLKFTSPFQD